MATALDAPAEILDQQEQSFVAKIREHGWFCTNVQADAEGPGFAYTTGFWVKVRQPEVIVFGLNDKTAHQVLWDVFRDAEQGRSLPVGTRTDQVFANLAAYAFPVAKRHYPDHLGWSVWFYGGADFPCLQIVWPDRAGVFPWQAGFDPSFAKDQPDLTENGWLAALAN
jgi:Domain of unknown function (DUF4262)